MDCSLPGSSVHGILQERTLEWIAISFSRGLFRPRNQTQVSWTSGIFFTNWATREARKGVQQEEKGMDSIGSVIRVSFVMNPNLQEGFEGSIEISRRSRCVPKEISSS